MDGIIFGVFIYLGVDIGSDLIIFTLVYYQEKNSAPIYVTRREIKNIKIKSLDQKENGRANMAILKSRFGKDGIVFEDIVFDNGTLVIDITENEQRGKSFLQAEEIKVERNQNRVTEVFDAMQDKKLADAVDSGTTNN